jgi:hypothetical protein
LDEPPATKHHPEGKQETKRHNICQLAHTGLARANAALQGASHSNPTKVPRHDKTSRRTKAIKQANSKIGNEKLKYQLPEAATTLCTH